MTFVTLQKIGNVILYEMENYFKIAQNKKILSKNLLTLLNGCVSIKL